MQVVAVWQNYDLRPQLEEPSTIIRETAQDWRDVLLEFQLKVNKKYGTSLCPGGTGNIIKDAAKKFRWLTEKEDIENLCKRLQSGSQTITLLTIATMRYVTLEPEMFASLSRHEQIQQVGQCSTSRTNS